MGKYNRYDKLPHDIQQQCLWIVRGYERNKRDYADCRRQILDGCTYSACAISSGNKVKSTRRTTEDTAALLSALDIFPAFRQMKAVEHALDIITDRFPHEIREKIKTALMLSCTDGRNKPFEHLDVPGISRSSFYRLRQSMLFEIATDLELYAESKYKQF